MGTSLVILLVPAPWCGRLVQRFVLCYMAVQASSTSIPFIEPCPPLPSPQDVSSLPHHRGLLTTVLCLGLSSEPHISAPSPCLQRWACLSGWVGRAGVRTPCAGLTLSCCHTRVAMFSPIENEALLLSKLSSPTRGFPGCGDRSSFSCPPRLHAPSHFLSSSFSFFFSWPTWLSRNVSVLVYFQGPLLVSSWAL